VDPTEGGVVGGGGEEEPGGRAGARVGGGETEARAVGEVGLAVETPSHVRLGDGEGRTDGAGERRPFLACLSLSFPLVFLSLSTRGGGVVRPATGTDTCHYQRSGSVQNVVDAARPRPRWNGPAKKNSFNLLASPNFNHTITYDYNIKPYSYSSKVCIYLSRLLYCKRVKELMNTPDRLLVLSLRCSSENLSSGNHSTICGRRIQVNVVATTVPCIYTIK
jgi:hypothetical protein